MHNGAWECDAEMSLMWGCGCCIPKQRCSRSCCQSLFWRSIPCAPTSWFLCKAAGITFLACLFSGFIQCDGESLALVTSPEVPPVRNLQGGKWLRRRRREADGGGATASGSSDRVDGDDGGRCGGGGVVRQSPVLAPVLLFWGAPGRGVGALRRPLLLPCWRDSEQHLPLAWWMR